MAEEEQGLPGEGCHPRLANGSRRVHGEGRLQQKHQTFASGLASVCGLEIQGDDPWFQQDGSHQQPGCS